MVTCASGNDIVFHGGVERRGIAPAQLHVVPGAVDLVSLHHHIRSSSNRLIHGNERLDDYIRRGQGGQFFILQEGAVDSIVAVTTVVGGVQIADGPLFRHHLVPDVGGNGRGMHNRIQNHRPLTAFIRQPFLRKQVGKFILSIAAGKGYLHIKAVLHFGIKEVGGRHGQDDLFLLGIIEINLSVFLLNRNQFPYGQAEAVAPECAVILGENDGLLQLVG